MPKQARVASGDMSGFTKQADSLGICQSSPYDAEIEGRPRKTQLPGRSSDQETIRRVLTEHRV